MVELQKKYQIGVRKFGLINWVGFSSLYKKEVLRFFAVWQQTLLSPLVSSGLFLLVLFLAIGNERGDVLGHSFLVFLAPGLICMQVCQQAFSHSSSSLMIGKMQNILVDTIMAPLSDAEITLAIILAAVTRSVIIAMISIIFFSFFIDLKINNFMYLIFFTVSGSFILGAAGLMAGQFSDKFDNLSAITNFVLTPLTFCSGTFYTLDRLPEILKSISLYNPIFLIINGFRTSFLGVSDGPILFSIIFLFILTILSWLISYSYFKSGHKIKT
tara:strand:+ start:1807 stop:2619 length:813 start_codon:yes stop_codon:yes gene_type:complete